MAANEDYLDNLLQSMLAEEGEDDGASKSLIDNSGLEESGDAITVDEEPSSGDAGSEEPASGKGTANASEAALKESDMGESNEEVAGKTLTPEEIEAMFAEMDEEDAIDESEASNPFSLLTEAEATEGDGAPSEDDLLNMLENMEQENPELSEINSLLEKSDNNEIVEDDMLALLEDGEDEGSDIHMGDDMGEEELQETKGKKKRAKKEKQKKEKVKKEKPEKSGGGGPLAKLFNILTEEEAPEQEQGAADEFAYEGEGGGAGGEGAPAGKKKKIRRPKRKKSRKKKSPRKRRSRKSRRRKSLQK